jgi:hypothetical protein
MSANAHFGLEQSRRDDILSIVNVLLYFFYGALPWQGTKAENSMNTCDLIGCKKDAVARQLDDLCQDLPEEIREFIKCANRLTFKQLPEYDYYRSLFRKGMRFLFTTLLQNI